MHRTFQRDLARLRLRVMKEYVKALDNSLSPISSDPMEPIKLNAYVIYMLFVTCHCLIIYTLFVTLLCEGHPVNIKILSGQLGNKGY